MLTILKIAKKQGILTENRMKTEGQIIPAKNVSSSKKENYTIFMTRTIPSP